ncbi:putative O-methyltransferase [Polyplosphaeria fusca]|uniref:O-methyltransferase n=1 Tax=Polyplosphaeria fusca TaxID=682080 RepID=A0A9P4QXY3_9PLEO|nr:putative O-methyltransferase [Polyplosphaeria fusca]
MSTSRILHLAQIIAAQTALVDEHISNSGVAAPSFEADAPIEPIQKSNAEVERARVSAVEASIELRQLLEGPIKLILPESNFAPLAAIYRFKIATAVSPEGSTSFTDIASKCGLLEHDVRRLIRYASAHHRCFQESEKGRVSHTAASKLLAENEQIGHLMGLTFAECWPAHSRSLDAMAQKSEEPNVSGFSLANSTRLNMFEFLAQNPDRAQRFAGAMSTTSQASLDALATYFDWANLPDGGTVVDVGGAQGHVSVSLAQRFPQLRFVVEDMQEVVKDAHNKIPDGLKEKIRLVAHDMFTEQPIKNADVFLLRYVLHDWPDKYCVKVIEGLAPALKQGAKVVIQDHLLPEPGSLSLLQEMMIRSMDNIMLSLFNSREREVDDWKDLFNRAHGKQWVVSVTRVKENPSTGIIVAEWLGDLES